MIDENRDVPHRQFQRLSEEQLPVCGSRALSPVKVKLTNVVNIFFSLWLLLLFFFYCDAVPWTQKLKSFLVKIQNVKRLSFLRLGVG